MTHLLIWSRDVKGLIILLLYICDQIFLLILFHACNPYFKFLNFVFRKPCEPWELADGCVHLVGELATIKVKTKDKSFLLYLVGANNQLLFLTFFFRQYKEGNHGFVNLVMSMHIQTPICKIGFRNSSFQFHPCSVLRFSFRKYSFSLIKFINFNVLLIY